MSTPDTLTRELAALDDALAGRPVDPDLADLGELALLLREDRPVADDAFARALDLKAERGFPRVRTKARRFGVKLPHIPMPALGVAASLVLVVGVTGVVLSQRGDDDTTASRCRRPGPVAIPERPAPPPAPAKARAPPAAGALPPASRRHLRPTTRRGQAASPPPGPPARPSSGRSRPRRATRTPTGASAVRSSAPPSSPSPHGRVTSTQRPPGSCGSPTRSAATSSPPRSPRARAASSSCGCPSGACPTR